MSSLIKNCCCCCCICWGLVLQALNYTISAWKYQKSSSFRVERSLKIIVYIMFRPVLIPDQNKTSNNCSMDCFFILCMHSTKRAGTKGKTDAEHEWGRLEFRITSLFTRTTLLNYTSQDQKSRFGLNKKSSFYSESQENMKS